MKVTNKPEGFSWGSMGVTRICSDPRHGTWLMVAGPKECVEIRATRTGRLRVSRIAKMDPSAQVIFAPKHAG